MKANVGSADKVIRIIVGIVIIAIGLAFKSWWGLIGLIPLLTAVVGYCPLYMIVGMSTCKTKSQQPPAAS